ncbi:MAG: sel1 repeat family protein [Bacilli bacterium]|nr:sel1 repeat family protein [Bacilli bacterium]
MENKNAWEAALPYFRFESTYGESGLKDLFEGWDSHSGEFFPPHEPLTLSEVVRGLDKVLSGELPFPKFKMWSRLACLSFSECPSDVLMDYGVLYEWERLNDELYPSNVSRAKMTELIREFKTTLMNQRFAFLPDKASDLGDRAEELMKAESLTKRQKKELIDTLMKLGDLGDFEAYNAVGSEYYTGRLGTQDYFKANEYYQKAAAMGSTQALINCGYIAYYARCGGYPDYQTAFNCFKKASKIGVWKEQVEALYKLSDMYDHGYATKMNRRKAFEIVTSLYEHLTEDTYAPGQEYLGDLSIRLAKFHAKDGVEPNPNASLRYYLQAKYLIGQRWDGQWFGDRKLLEDCDREIPKLVESVFGGEYPREKMDLSIYECALLLMEGAGYDLSNIIYDDERGELYLYLRSWSVKTIETIPYVGSFFSLCLIFKVKKAKLFPHDFLDEGFLLDVRMEPAKGYDESPIRHWALRGYIDDEKVDIATFTADFKCHGHVGYIRNMPSGIAYMDPSFSQPKGYDPRCVLRFGFDDGDECLFAANEEAYEKCGYPCDIDKLGLSEGLLEDLFEAMGVYENHMHADGPSDDGYWNEKQWAKFYEQVEKPLYERVKEELGDGYLVLYEGGGEW